MSMHFIKRILEIGFLIVIWYVDSVELVRTLKELIKLATYLKIKEFGMKDLGKAKCLGI